MHFSDKVLQWFDQYGRKNLPWQQEINAYRVWVSEIMLQQTQVQTVIPYYLRFMESFPTVAALAQADSDEVLHHWSGLGYYQRARNLHKTAKIIHLEMQDEFPQTAEELSQLPGIGRSTAGAIASIAFQQHAAILDGNVKRVLARSFAVEGWPNKASVLKQLWQVAEKNTPQERTADYTQAMMDLGAMVCKRSKPLCQECPLQENCLAYQQGRIGELPGKKPKKTIPIRQTIMLVSKHQDSVLLYQRPSTGIWPSLYSFPEFATQQELDQFLLLNFPSQALETKPLDQFRHSFSHYHLEINAKTVDIPQKPLSAMEGDRILWYNMQNPQDIGLAAPVQRLLNKLKKPL